MRDLTALQTYLDGAHVDDAVLALRPDYRALLLAVDGIEPRPSDVASEELLLRAEQSAREQLATVPVEQLPHIAAWREAYKAMGSKPSRTRNSAEALLRRAEAGLPRVNTLTDVYNAVSLLHHVPIGGEDLDRYAGPPRLIRATGQEPFDTMTSGETVVEHPDPGEVVWTDQAGVTCRRWNWRQAKRTQLTDHTTAALFILDALEPLSDDELGAAGDELIGHLRRLGRDVRVARRLLGQS
ncbi:phenylalanine--tRNA ligase beta subunit-related protein [Georgenia sp. MJ206]|uniref:B3/B4 domain-containing protein n=1 Tax=Georgenia wangjunii TaxID=3117730 RepID=UPI002F264D19